MATVKKNKTQPPATKQNFPIVGIGASAGGLDAFKKLLTAIPENSGMAYVLVQHLDPTHESMLPDILQRVTNIPVHEITDDIHLAPDHIYIIPSNKILTSTDGVLQLAPRDKKILNLSIDIFFKMLAEVHKEFAVGVILSGTGQDGTKGLKAIKEYGGISIAQDIESAAYGGMPESAINAGVVDFILAPEKIPEHLLQINRIDKTNHIYKKENQQNNDDEAIFKQILSLLRQRSGVDFTHYKDPTLRRRIARRTAIVKKKNLTNYLKFLRTDIAEQNALFQDMLIPVTSFFRDPKTFQTLTETVFPSILENKNPDAPIRMWIAGCSTGEEVYSIAICLQEFLGANSDSYRDRTRIQLFASDISEKAIKKARSGVYTEADVEMLSASQLENYFTKNNGGYEVSKGIRDICVFAPHNFLKDPPFAKMDLISCRNVLIYMDTFLQQKAFATFHYALKETGFLLLGKSESIGASSDLFVQVEKKEKIFSRKQVLGRFRHVVSEVKDEALTKKTKTVAKPESTQTDFKKSAEAIMISKAPASVVVNEQMDIVHIHGDLTPFLKAPQGKPTHNLLSMARDGLTFELRNAIHKASKDKIAVTTENIPLKIYAPMNNPDNNQDGQGKQTLVAMEIIPITDTVEQHYLIRFEKIIIPLAKAGKSASSAKTKAGEAEKRNEQLEKELAYNREDMRSITEDMEAANEELQSANEELQSSNEEMQSLNEEMETS
jgi:two-component system CheB/CheR fusion protein